MELTRTNSADPQFLELVRELDQELADRYGAAQSFFDQFNKLDLIRNVVIASKDGIPIGCGAFKPYSESDVEIKRMFVTKNSRGIGTAALILGELEAWALELKFTHAILETGTAQQEAIRLYTREGYTLIENFGQYIGVELSVCMRKALRQL